MANSRPGVSLRRLLPGVLLVALLGPLLALAACADAHSPPREHTGRPIGLFTSLPILWAESEDLRALLRSDTPPHWVLAALRRRGEVRPLDHLLGDGDAPAALAAGLDRIVMAQPRPLSPQENVALDAWVRAGGRLLLFADPMLTEESGFALGDRRRPQDIVLLSPILEHWKLRLEFDEEQAPGERMVDPGGVALAVNLPGRFVVAPGSGHCALLGGGLVAQCRIGKGQVLLVADAAMLERDRDPGAAGAGPALDWLLAKAGFGA